MNAFFQRLLESKKNLILLISVVLILSIGFGFFEFNHVSKQMQNIFKDLFYLNKDSLVNYQNYVIFNGVYIFICTYLSTSYMGSIGLIFMLFLKGIQISFSLVFIFLNTPFSMIILLLVFIQLIIEIIFCICLHYMTMYISIYNLLVSFFIKDNFNVKSILNYKLNMLILTLVIFCIGLALRIYIVPLF